MSEEIKKLLEEIKAYRNDMVARNYPFQQISDIITRWENKKDFLEEAEKEKKELAECYQEAKRQTEERKAKEWLKGYKEWKKENNV
jgi:vacuolar-type H+-ATPase subunit I/STV1